MKRWLRRYFKSSLRNNGFEIISQNKLKRLRQEANAYNDTDFLKCMEDDVVTRILRLLDKSKSQFRQDLFVLSELGFKRNGFFVEFGATNGVKLSNTHLLEKGFAWDGILAEPAQIWHKELKVNRSVNIEFECVWKKTGALLNFDETEIAELSTISDFSSGDLHKETRKNSITYPVKSISLNDLLKRYNAPHQIDYLSIDTEGSEYEIMKAFDFDAYQFSVITCEHNFTDSRQRLHDLFKSQGYIRKFEQLSACDDWYVRK